MSSHSPVWSNVTEVGVTFVSMCIALFLPVAIGFFLYCFWRIVKSLDRIEAFLRQKDIKTPLPSCSDSENEQTDG